MSSEQPGGDGHALSRASPSWSPGRAAGPPPGTPGLSPGVLPAGHPRARRAARGGAEFGARSPGDVLGSGGGSIGSDSLPPAGSCSPHTQDPGRSLSKPARTKGSEEAVTPEKAPSSCDQRAAARVPGQRAAVPRVASGWVLL